LKKEIKLKRANIGLFSFWLRSSSLSDFQKIDRDLAYTRCVNSEVFTRVTTHCRWITPPSSHANVAVINTADPGVALAAFRTGNG
jgi:hypothetical protein